MFSKVTNTLLILQFIYTIIGFLSSFSIIFFIFTALNIAIFSIEIYQSRKEKKK